MQAFLMDKDTYLIYKDDKTTEEVSKVELEKAVSVEPVVPEITDKELLEWAKINHPFFKIEDSLVKIIADKQEVLDSINNIEVTK